jgi:hypothetical protein
MMRLLWLVLLVPLGGSLFGQTQIGGGTCNSATLSGPYTFTLAGRQVSASGAFTGIFQANGTANFDGTNKATLTMSASTVQMAGTPLTYSGTYSVQANCAGSMNITVGDSATFNLLVYNQGKSFLVTGTDASYTYSGGGSIQPASCGANLLSGAYVFSTTGFTLAGGSISGALNSAGLVQLDGHNALTVNFSYVSPNQSPMTLSLSGTYALTSGCAGTGTLADPFGNSYSLAFTVSGGSSVSTTAFDLILAQANKLLFSGSAHAVFGQPTASSQLVRRSGGAA